MGLPSGSRPSNSDGPHETTILNYRFLKLPRYRIANTQEHQETSVIIFFALRKVSCKEPAPRWHDMATMRCLGRSPAWREEFNLASRSLFQVPSSPQVVSCKELVHSPASDGLELPWSRTVTVIYIYIYVYICIYIYRDTLYTI